MALTSINSAIQAYNTAAKSLRDPAAGAAGETAPTLDFGSLLQQGADAAISAGKKSEEVSKQALSGKADVRDVVAAVNNAELTLETVVAIRDKVIAAYSDILKMPI
jgi:flagellar hook-basal body complex protein FliE